VIEGPRRTKIVATLGPATSDDASVAALIEAGVDVFRLNFSHGDHDGHRDNLARVRAAAVAAGRPVGVLQDLQGPKIRTARFAEGQVTLVPGAPFTLSCADDTPGDKRRVGVTYTGLARDVTEGDTLLLDDGRLSLRVVQVTADDILTEVVTGGVLSNNKGINIPGADLSIPALTEKDMVDLAFGAELGVDWVAMSFVRSRDDLLLARHYLARAGSSAKLMAKVEKPAAVERFTEILHEVDGVMVARGDLGVELPPESVPPIQKRLIRACQEAGKPVVTATQMLESMIVNPTPTRAESSDVANAIYDGSDAVMLSGETAVGAYPLRAVQMMARIAHTVERDPQYLELMREHAPAPDDTTPDAVSSGAVQISNDLGASLVVSFTSSGNTAARVARYRPAAPILAITPSERVYRQLTVSWGVIPYQTHDLQSTDEMVEVAIHAIGELGLAEPAARFLITAGVPFGIRGTTNMIRVERYRP
jgi:pyruvate kinase